MRMLQAVEGTQEFILLSYHFDACENFHNKNLKINFKNVGGKKHPPPTPAHVGEKDTTEVLRVEKNESNLMCP